MGVEGGITKVYLRPGVAPAEAKFHLSIVGISFDGPHRNEVRAWVRQNPCPPDELRDEWNSAVDWQGLAELPRIVEECEGIVEGVAQYTGLPPTATFRDVLEEVVTSPIPEECAWPFLVEGLMRAQGAFEPEDVDLEKVPTMAVREWAGQVMEMFRNGGPYPRVVSIEVWT